MGPSRVYLGHHWASDVLAAYAIGLVYLLGGIWLHWRLRFARFGWAQAPLVAWTA